MIPGFLHYRYQQTISCFIVHPFFRIVDFCGSQWKAKLSGERAPSVLMKGGEERQRKVRTGFWQQIQALKGDRRVLERQRRKTPLRQ